MTQVRYVALGEVCEIRRGTTITQKQARSGDVPVVAGGIEPSYFHDTANRAGNVVSVSGSGANAGYVNFWEVPIFASDCSTVESRGEDVDIRYVHYFLRSKQQEISALRTGAAQPHVYPRDIAPLLIPLVPLSDQRRIVDLLSRAEGIVRLRREASAKAAELIPALFLHLFGDPATNPKAWPVKLLGELGVLDRGKSRHRPRDAQELYGGPYPFIQTGDVSNCGGRITRYEQTYSELGLAQSRLWPAGTLCITIAANIARTGVLGFDACFPDSVVGFSPSDETTTDYIQHWLGFLQPMLEKNAPQAAQKNINLNILRNLPVPVPPLALQRDFAAKVANLQAIAALQASATAQAQSTFNALLHRAFST
jgi:type I restriction enzyme S subunit